MTNYSFILLRHANTMAGTMGFFVLALLPPYFSQCSISRPWYLRADVPPPCPATAILEDPCSTWPTYNTQGGSQLHQTLERHSFRVYLLFHVIQTDLTLHRPTVDSFFGHERIYPAVK